MSKRLSQSDRLRQYNRWRRGEDSIPYPDPKELGELIDGVADRLEVLEQEHEALHKAMKIAAENLEDTAHLVATGVAKDKVLRSLAIKIKHAEAALKLGAGGTAIRSQK